MELIISRLSKLHEGMELTLKEDNQIRSLAIINGNKPEFKGPVVLFSIDQHVIYGLSHPSVISRIYTSGPQKLLTARELAHNIFEHGMKASVGQIKIKNNLFFTQIETFYTVVKEVHNLKLIIGERNKPAILVQPRQDYKPIVISPHNFQFKDTEYTSLKILEIDNIQNYITARFEPV